MAWVAVGSTVAGAVVGGVMNGSKGGGGGQTATKDPWSAAVPWLTANLQSGQNLQNAYAQNPFSQQQQLAYLNQFKNSDDYSNFARSILGQMGQRQGFDRNNSGARPQPFQLPAMGARFGYDQAASQTNPFASAVMQAAAQGAQAPAAPAAPAALPDSYTPGTGSDWWSTRDAAGA